MFRLMQENRQTDVQTDVHTDRPRCRMIPDSCLLFPQATLFCDGRELGSSEKNNPVLKKRTSYHPRLEAS